MTRRCPCCFPPWADLLPQPGLSGTVLRSFSRDNAGTKPSAQLAYDVNKLRTLRLSEPLLKAGRVLATHCSFKPTIGFCLARPSVTAAFGFWLALKQLLLYIPQIASNLKILALIAMHLICIQPVTSLIKTVKPLRNIWENMSTEGTGVHLWCLFLSV